VKKILLVLLLLPFCVFAQNTNLNAIIDNQIVEKTTFYGLASYYNNVNFYILNEKGLASIEPHVQTLLEENDYLVAVGRFKTLLVKAKELSFQVDYDNHSITVENPELLDVVNTKIEVIAKPDLKASNPLFDQIRYHHLWAPLAWLAKVMESSVAFVHNHIASNWGWAIIIFGILLKIILLPAGILTTKYQRKVSQVKTALEPKLAEIKANFDGEEAHHKIMAAHKELGVSPFYTLKPMLGSFIQIPVLIAVFNALGEMPLLNHQAFLWIDNLAFPDSIAQLPFTLPLFGHTLSLLPAIMTLVTIFSTIIFKNKFASTKELKSQKVKLYLMAFAFFVLFYPFPAAMVLYWALANILQTIQQQIIKI